jgi:hypothetical protein
VVVVVVVHLKLATESAGRAFGYVNSSVPSTTVTEETAALFSTYRPVEPSRLEAAVEVITLGSDDTVWTCVEPASMEAASALRM